MIPQYSLSLARRTAFQRKVGAHPPTLSEEELKAGRERKPPISGAYDPLNGYRNLLRDEVVLNILTNGSNGKEGILKSEFYVFLCEWVKRTPQPDSAMITAGQRLRIRGYYYFWDRKQRKATITSQSV